MTNQNDQEQAFERRAREVFDASVEGLDARTRSRLNQARHAATAEIERSRRSPWRSWAPAGALAAAALMAVMLWRAPVTPDATTQQARTAPAAVQDENGDATEVLAAGDDLDLVSEDLEFYEFVAYATDESGNQSG
jgi:ferric-dicitrate binding protein FerR (iron transport regulator)